MIHILIMLLKIIGYFLLAAFMIALLGILLVLFCPVKYVFHIGNAGVSFEADWFFRIAAAYYKVIGEHVNWQIRLGWWKINKPLRARRKRKSRKNPKSGSQEFESMDVKTEKHDTSKKEKGKWTDFTKHVNIKQEYLGSVKKILCEMLILFKKAKPKHLAGYLEYGFEDPSDTGKLLAFLATCYPILEDRVEIIPNFEEKKFDIRVDGYGYMFLIHVLQLFLRVFRNKDIRVTLKDVKKYVLSRRSHNVRK